MIVDYRPLVRRRAPYPPSRGVYRCQKVRSLPRLPGARRYQKASGELYVSSRIPDSVLPAVFEEFERHSDNSGRDVTLDGRSYTQSSFASEAGSILLVTNTESAITYAYYDWEEKP